MLSISVPIENYKNLTTFNTLGMGCGRWIFGDILEVVKEIVLNVSFFYAKIVSAGYFTFMWLMFIYFPWTKNPYKKSYIICLQKFMHLIILIIIAGVWPWMAAISYSSPNSAHQKFQCSAILISKQWVLTAAHCVQFTGSFKPWEIIFIFSLNRSWCES